MEAITARYERAFDAFSDQGDEITFESYTGQGKRLAALRGEDPDSPAVVRLTEQLESMWGQFAPMADADNDGRIDRDDFSTFAVAMSATLAAIPPDEDWPLNPYVRLLYELIDADSDGCITKAEYADWLESYGLASDTDIDAAFASFDLDGNGTLSWEEFSKSSRAYWTTSDPDIPGARWMGP